MKNLYGSNPTRKNVDIGKLTKLGVLIALELVLNLTGLGFIRIPPVAITIMPIPVILGGIILGPGAGGVLGGVFGLLSIWESTTKGATPIDLAFSPFYSGSPISSIVMALGCRILLGLAAGWLFMLFSKMDKKGFIAPILTALFASLIHTFSVLSCVWLLFPDLGVVFKSILAAVFSLNFLVEAGVGMVFAFGFAKIIPMLRRKTPVRGQ